jgi:fucose 4-O-acetylase-like acetyltransferase
MKQANNWKYGIMTSKTEIKLKINQLMKHDDSIDFIKGIAILLVIIFHCIIGYTNKVAGVISIEQGVPLFLLVSSYLYFKSQENKPVTFYGKHHFIKMFNRIFVPFFIFQIPILLISFYKSNISIFNVVAGGGIGMGSYYPWLYFQFWLLLPCFSYLIKNKKLKMWHAIAISITLEIAFNLIASINVINNFSDVLWRLFVGRYVFIIYIGFLLAKNRFNYKTFAPITFIGVIITLVQRYDIWNIPFLYYALHGVLYTGILS